MYSYIFTDAQGQQHIFTTDVLLPSGSGTLQQSPASTQGDGGPNNPKPPV